MKQYQRFQFDSYGYDGQQITLRYNLDDEVLFEEKILLPDMPTMKAGEELTRALFALQLAGGVSYYKTCCPKELVVKSGVLSKAQAAFWNTVYTKGLGEFFFKNQIDFRGLINFPSSGSATAVTPPSHTGQGYLVPIGGGKDSMVTIERLKKEGKKITLFRMGKHPLIDALVQETGLPCLTVERRLSPNLFELNAEGALNGHIPITTYLSFLCVALAELYGYEAVVLSSEKSANEGNVEYLGEEINHQWSKSAEAETLIRTYVHDWINPVLKYENPLRDMSELEIAKEFCTYPQYFELFTSCNTNWKIAADIKGKGSRWCGKCPKCAFVFTLMAANLPKETVLKIFGKDLYADASLSSLYKELLGLEAFKPFECVGTPEETKEAMMLAKKTGQYENEPILNLLDARA